MSASYSSSWRSTLQLMWSSQRARVCVCILPTDVYFRQPCNSQKVERWSKRFSVHATDVLKIRRSSLEHIKPLISWMRAVGAQRVKRLKLTISYCHCLTNCEVSVHFDNNRYVFLMRRGPRWETCLSSCSALLLDARFGVHFFLGSPDISYIISTDFDRNQLLWPTYW